MSISIAINGNNRSYRDLREIDEGWINQQVTRRKKDGQIVCVKVDIDNESARLALSSYGCQGGMGGGGGRQPTPRERAIFDLWEECGLKDASYSGGHVIKFLKQLRNLL